MAFPFFHYNSKEKGALEPPFSIVVEAKDAVRLTSWRPEASVRVNRTLRTSGFLTALPPEELKHLLLMLSFLTPNGHVAPDIVQLASALHVSPAKARTRMHRLAALRWHNQAFVLPVKHGNGLDTFALAPGFVPTFQNVPQEPPAPPLQGGFRDAVIAHSRRRYARPRAEVEAFVNRQLSRNAQLSGVLSAPEPTSVEPEDESRRALRNDLLGVGLEAAQADDLIARFDSIRIRRQLAWLPYRPVRNRAGFLIAAIKDDYEAPRTLPRPIAPDKPYSSDADHGGQE